eukprot:6627279-Heterocapsa_arctica.AAC.1
MVDPAASCGDFVSGDVQHATARGGVAHVLRQPVERYLAEVLGYRLVDSTPELRRTRSRRRAVVA